MGGSGLGPDVVKHLFKEQLTVPFEVVNSYSLPNYVDHHTLVVLASYSGNTEEVLSCAQQAEQQQAQIIVITSGGKLQELAEKNKYPAYIISPEHNPSNQPRMAIGYAIFGLIGLLKQVGILELDTKTVNRVAKTIINTMHDCRVDKQVEANPAKTLAFSLVERRPNLVAAEFLLGAVHVASNQFNENAKTFADYYSIPEINHHLLEGLMLPPSNVLDNIFLFFNSQLYHERNQQRMTLTQEAVEKQGIQSLAINLTAETKIEQVFELITLMAYANFYLAMLHEINPSQIPTVEWFKTQLEQE
jgi:glucose/mannose-6-phosphate isomerase